RPIIGAANTVWVTGSPVGVITAEMMKVSSTAYLNCWMRNRAVIRFIFARKNTIVGIWKTAAIAMRNLVYSEKTASSFGMNWRSCVLKLAKNAIIHGNMM